MLCVSKWHKLSGRRKELLQVLRTTLGFPQWDNRARIFLISYFQVGALEFHLPRAEVIATRPSDVGSG